MTRAWFALGAWSLLVLAACERTPPNATPEGAVRELVDVVRGFAGDEREAQIVFELLSERAKKNMRGRAERYSAASGKTIAPWAMLAPSRMTPQFSPQAYTAQIVGKYALVDVAGVSPEQVAHIPCVFEDAGWRVDLVLPELPAMLRRPGSGE